MVRNDFIIYVIRKRLKNFLTCNENHGGTRGVNSILTLGGGGVRDFCPAKLEIALRKVRYIAILPGASQFYLVLHMIHDNIDMLNAQQLPKIYPL